VGAKKQLAPLSIGVIVFGDNYEAVSGVKSHAAEALIQAFDKCLMTSEEVARLESIYEPEIQNQLEATKLENIAKAEKNFWLNLPSRIIAYKAFRMGIKRKRVYPAYSDWPPPMKLSSSRNFIQLLRIVR
jgi:hypothetical protein